VTKASVAERDFAIVASHFRRMFAERNCDRVIVFANGHVYDKAQRRKTLRSNIAMLRKHAQRIREEASKMRMQELQAEYDAYVATLSTKRCGAIPTRTVRDCVPPSINNYRCSICNMRLYAADESTTTNTTK